MSRNSVIFIILSWIHGLRLIFWFLESWKLSQHCSRVQPLIFLIDSSPCSWASRTLIFQNILISISWICHYWEKGVIQSQHNPQLLFVYSKTAKSMINFLRYFAKFRCLMTLKTLLCNITFPLTLLSNSLCRIILWWFSKKSKSKLSRTKTWSQEGTCIE